MLGELPWWVTIVILVRELGITVLRFVVIRYGVIPASRGGKLKTVLQTAGDLPVPAAAGVLCRLAGWVAFAVMMVAVRRHGVDRRRIRRGSPAAAGAGERRSRNTTHGR